jgi:hypothetical protein
MHELALEQVSLRFSSLFPCWSSFHLCSILIYHLPLSCAIAQTAEYIINPRSLSRFLRPFYAAAMLCAPPIWVLVPILCCSHALCAACSRSVVQPRGCTSTVTVRLLPLPLPPWVGDILHYLGRSAVTGGWKVALSSGRLCRKLRSFPFSLVLRGWAGEEEGLVWAPVVTRLWWLQTSVMPSGKDPQGYV